MSRALAAGFTLLIASAACSGAPVEVARAAIAGRARPAMAAPPAPSHAEAAREPLALAGAVITDVRDVRACLPLADGRTLAATAGGVWLVGADGETLGVATSLDGLPDTKTHALLDLGGGRLAVGTEQGVAFVHVTPKNVVVDRSVTTASARALARRGEGIAVATWGQGLVVVRVEGAAKPRRLTSREARFTSLTETGGVLYAGSVSGVYRVDGDQLALVEAAEPNAPVFALGASNDDLWIGGLVGLRRRTAAGAEAVSSLDVRAIARDGDGLLLASLGGGVLEARGGAIEKLSSLGPAPASAQAVGVAHGARCVGTREGLFVQARRAEAFHAIPAPALPSGDVSAIARDATDDGLWVGTFDHGLARLANGRFTPVSGVDARVNAIAVSAGSAWIATARGVFHVEPRGSAFLTTPFTAEDGLPSSDVHAVAALADGGVVVGTSAGAAVVRGAHVTPLGEKIGIPRGGVWAVAETAGGLLVLGTSRGLLIGAEGREGVVARTDPRAESPAASKTWLAYSMATGDLDDDWVTALYLRNSAVYVGTYNAGVTRLDIEPAAANVVRHTHLADGYVNFGALAPVGDHLFAGTMTGLVEIGSKRHIADAAPGLDVTALAPIPGGAWIATRRGLSRWTP